jgi:hypothetical protein
VGAGPKLDEILPVPTNFGLTTAERLRGMEGLPRHLVRKREIQDLGEKLIVQLSKNTFDETLLARLNRLIEAHNRFYPIEANLPIDRRTGGSLEYGRPWRPMAPVTRASLRAELDARAR